jgi:hypothetical protein
MQFTPDGRLAPEPVWCQMHYSDADFHYTDDLVGWWAYTTGPGPNRFVLLDAGGPWPVGRDCAAAAVARGDTDPRSISEWRG